MNTLHRALILLPAAAVLAVCTSDSTAPWSSAETGMAAPMFALAASHGAPVSFSAVLFSSTAFIHSEVPTETGMIQRSTAVVRLTGDLEGWVVFQPISTFDFTAGTLVNTGTQIFAGTILGSDPVILHDDEFRFDVDLATGATTGKIRFSRSNDAPHRGGWFECDIDMVGTGVTPEGDPTSNASGVCVRRGNIR